VSALPQLADRRSLCISGSDTSGRCNEFIVNLTTRSGENTVEFEGHVAQDTEHTREDVGKSKLNVRATTNHLEKVGMSLQSSEFPHTALQDGQVKFLRNDLDQDLSLILVNLQHNPSST
jgi:hypothetical protein